MRFCERLAALVPDGRDPTRVKHEVANMFLARSLAISAGYEDADDLDDLRHDPAFKLALGKTPPSEVMRPPSKAALTFLPETAGRDGKSEAVSAMAARQFLSEGTLGLHNHFFTLNQSIMPPPPANLRGLVNNQG
ncbi:MAG: hypothetical protein GY717_16140 [Rhodobacteraceae bacterium]|nr:hypothetical protein [Paracoccaceae bacterium]